MTQRRLAARRPVQLSGAQSPSRLNDGGESFTRFRLDDRPLEPAPSLDSAVDSAVVGGGRVLILGNVTNVVGLERRSIAGGRRFGVDRRDRSAFKHRLDGGLTELPTPGPQQPYRSVNRIHNPAASLVQQRSKDRWKWKKN